MEPKIDLSGITISGEDDHMGGYEFTPSAEDTITLSSYPWSNTSIASGGYTVNNAGVSASSYPYTVTGITTPWTSSPKIQLNGEGADIEVNGWCLIDAIKKIEERLNILHPNTKLEAEWAELRTLGDRYRELEQHIKDKQATWDRLKAMPAPVIE